MSVQFQNAGVSAMLWQAGRPRAFETETSEVIIRTTNIRMHVGYSRLRPCGLSGGLSAKSNSAHGPFGFALLKRRGPIKLSAIGVTRVYPSYSGLEVQ